jgi:hypothetical protein
MVRFSKGGTDSGGFVGAGGKLGTICTPFTGTRPAPGPTRRTATDFDGALVENRYTP